MRCEMFIKKSDKYKKGRSYQEKSRKQISTATGEERRDWSADLYDEEF